MHLERIMGLQSRQYKKVAVVHDILIEFGGAERVLTAILEIYPDADVYTFFYNKKEQLIAEEFPKVRSSFLSELTFLSNLKQYFSFLKLFSWLYFYFLDLSEYDLIISSSHSFNSKIIRKKSYQLHISYIHTPPRYLYGLPHQLEIIKKDTFKLILFPIIYFLKRIDFFASQQPDILISNSETVRNRVKRVYERSSFVVYPPVDTLKLAKKEQKKYYYIAHSRLVRHKGMELIIETCTRFSIPLVVVGDGYLRKELEKRAGTNIIFTGFVDDKVISKLYQHAIALLFAAKSEDFGIIPVESQSYGVPVVAYASGGVKETVTHGISGFLFGEYSIAGLKKAIDQFECMPLKNDEIIKQAKRFSKKRFKKELKQIINEA